MAVKKNPPTKKAAVNVNAFIGVKRYANDPKSYINDAEFTALFDAAEATDADVIDVNINSAGGNIINGNSIINRMKKSKKKVVAHIDALAASMGYFICLGASEIRAAKNSLIMPHSAQGSITGTPEEMIAEAEVLKKFRESIAISLADRMKKTVEEVTAEFLGEDKWYTAQEALEAGLIDGIDDFDAINELPSAELIAVPFGEFVAQWNPKAKAAEAANPEAALITSLNNDERWFYEDLLCAERSQINSASNILKYTNNSAVIELARKTIDECSLEVISLTALLYGAGTDASAMVEELMAAREAKSKETYSAAAVVDFNARLKIKEAAITKLTTEKTAALQVVEEKTAEIERLEGELLNREVDNPEQKALAQRVAKRENIVGPP